MTAECPTGACRSGVAIAPLADLAVSRTSATELQLVHPGGRLSLQNVDSWTAHHLLQLPTTSLPVHVLGDPQAERLVVELRRLFSRCLVSAVVLSCTGEVQARLRPLGRLSSPALPVPSIRGDDVLSICHTASVRRTSEHVVLRVPIHGMVADIWGPDGALLLGALLRPTPAGRVAERVPVICSQALQAWIAFFALSGGLEPYALADLPDSVSVGLSQRSPDDLDFHAQSRRGTRDGGYGATFRFLGRLEPTPALPARRAGATTVLPRPDGEGDRMTVTPLGEVLASRRSVRQHGAEPLTLDDLGAFLHHSARMDSVRPVDAEAGQLYETSRRPYPSAGATYDLEVYLVVNACRGLQPGVYHYLADEHSLEVVSRPSAASALLSHDARNSSGADSSPQVVVVLASRFNRLSWKYEGIAYAATLKNVGVMYHQMYLVATALGLACCALGGGDSALFAEITGRHHWEESSVGELLLGSLPATPRTETPREQI